jgi:uncharacterized repeat protein (TIGR04138 family)
MVEGQKLSQIDLCVECAKPEMWERKGIELGRMLELLKSGTGASEAIMKEAFGGALKYPEEAYEFVREALDVCQGEKMGHVSGCELLKSIRELAVQKFGKGAGQTLANWKIFRTEDFGEIIFEMIDAGLLSKQPGDTKEEFQNGFYFDEAFPEG